MKDHPNQADNSMFLYPDLVDDPLLASIITPAPIGVASEMSDLNAVQALLPLNKAATEEAEALVALGYPAVAPVLPELLECLQDYNWPVAHVLAPFLGSIGLPLLPHIRDILATNDTIWKYWVLSCAVEPSPPLALALREELWLLANAPTPDEIAEELDRKARELLDGLGEGTEAV